MRWEAQHRSNRFLTTAHGRPARLPHNIHTGHHARRARTPIDPGRPVRTGFDPLDWPGVKRVLRSEQPVAVIVAGLGCATSIWSCRYHVEHL